jgi:hypothetical protein
MRSGGSLDFPTKTKREMIGPSIQDPAVYVSLAAVKEAKGFRILRLVSLAVARA